MARHGTARQTVSFEGYEILKRKLDAFGGDTTKKAIEVALKDSQRLIAEQSRQAMIPHNRTGQTSASIIDSGQVIWTGTEAYINVGFNIKEGGLPSIFLMYGTKVHGQPHQQPDRTVYNAVYGTATKREIKRLQEEAFRKALEEATRG